MVVEHAQLWQTQVTQLLHVMVCGTAGSGKTWLIRAIKQTLGTACLVLAPTGVAADNIGGCTYHSVLPVPSKDIDREEIVPRCKTRINKMVTTLTGVSHIIIDEMSMVGRRSLGQIEKMLQVARRNTERFGGFSIIFVGGALQRHAYSKPFPVRLTAVHKPSTLHITAVLPCVADHGQLPPVNTRTLTVTTGVECAT